MLVQRQHYNTGKSGNSDAIPFILLVLAWSTAARYHLQSHTSPLSLTLLMYDAHRSL